jgi:hypothetical protein
MPHLGCCQCGAVTFRVTADKPLIVYACHCLDCQTWSSSAFTEHALLQEGDINVDGPTTIYISSKNDTTTEHILCAVCHTRILNRNAAASGMVFLRAGALTNSHTLSPAAHIWTKRKQPWIVLPSGVPSWPESPTPEQFFAAVFPSRGPESG